MVVFMSKELFEELKAEVRNKGLLERVPIRGSVEMTAIIVSIGLLYTSLWQWDIIDINHSYKSILFGFFMSLVFTRAVFVSHDILHRQYFKDKSLSFNLSYPFAAIILSNSSSLWDFKHNVNHHMAYNLGANFLFITL